ncbi:uncharacterized protein LOC123548649 [Mercenaria mercenaria]|uniref:uncharacterized protein LOC123548649 n=1 Tax=Mercenaria mercenaria TaxID=6596 RepID=UPI00234E783F|nr:uncharacterized protein LOC123548649 [Mercenaria mercenaria]
MDFLPVLLFGCITIAHFGFNAEAAGTKYGEAFKNLITENGYKGGETGVLLGNRLGYVEGYGRTITGHNVYPESLLPASGISKIITALTVLRLIQEGSINPTDKIFGEKGKLPKMTPNPKKITDKRILEITVDDLLRHAGGWDAEISPIGDPVFNEFLVDGNHHLVNISKEMKLKSPLDTFDVISFMASRKLEFMPGTQSSVSNLGYLILGRVIEETTGLPYDVVVKEELLNNCGMWHTRLGPHTHEGRQVYKGRNPREINAELREKHEVIGEYYAYAQTYMVDSCLGWFTNAYDVMRLAQCLDGSADYQLLNDTTIETMIRRPRLDRSGDASWYGAGFKVHQDGAIWVGEEPHAPDAVFLHRNLKRHKPGTVYTSEENEPMSWTLLFEGKPAIDAPLKQLSRAMVEGETQWPKTNAFVNDLHDKLLTIGRTTKLHRLKVEEHRANAYLIALKRADFNVIWLNAYTHAGGTFITTIAEQDPKASRECVAVAGLTREKLVEKKLELEKLGYNMTFFQNYKSFSHRDKFVFLAVFHKGAFRNDSHILYGIQHFDRPYKTLLNLYEEKGYRPLVQSLEYNRDDALLSFILEADSDKEKDQKPLYSSEENLSEARLEKCVRKYAREQKRLIYLDASNHRGKPKFSALFKKTRMTKWLFSQGLTSEDLLITIAEKQKEGYLPSIVIGYSTKRDDLLFATYMEKPL